MRQYVLVGDRAREFEIRDRHGACAIVGGHELRLDGVRERGAPHDRR